MGSDKGSLLEILLSRKMRLSLLLIIALVAVSGIHSEDNLENESGISKEAVKSVSQDNIAHIDIEKTLEREKREAKKKAKKKWSNGTKKRSKGKVEKSGKGNRSGKGQKKSNKKNGAKKGKGKRKSKKGSKTKMKKSSKTKKNGKSNKKNSSSKKGRKKKKRKSKKKVKKSSRQTECLKLECLNNLVFSLKIERDTVRNFLAQEKRINSKLRLMENKQNKSDSRGPAIKFLA